MRSFGPAMIAILLAGLLAVQAYITIKPAFHVAAVSCAGIAIYLFSLRRPIARTMASRVLATAIGMPMLAWWLPSIWALYAIMLLWVPLVAGRITFVVPLYLYGLLLLPGLDSTVALASVKLLDFSVHDALGLGAAYAVFQNTGKAKPRPSLDMPAVAVMLMLAAALSRNTSITNFLRVTINVVFDLGLPYYIVSRGIRTMEELRMALVWLGCGAATLAAILCYETWKSWPIYNQLYDLYHLPTLLLVKARAGYLRAGGPFVEPTSIAMVMATCILALSLSRDYFRSNSRYALVFALVLIGMAAPQSRGAWIGLSIAIALSLAFQGRYARLLQAGCAIGVTGALLFLLARVSPSVSETLGLSGGASASANYRHLLFDRGMEEFLRSPIVGYSMPEITARLSDIRQGEGIVDFVNTYIWLLLISGVVGTALFLGTFLYFMLQALKYRRPVADLPGNVAAAAFVFVGLAMPMEMLFFTSFGGRPAFFIFVLFGFAVALANIREGRRRAMSRAAPAMLGALTPASLPAR